MITFENRDCMEALAEFPAQYFDLAIVDPPYGDGKLDSQGGEYNRFGGHFAKYKSGPDPADQDGPELDRTGRGWAKKYGRKIVSWDVAPGPEYFEELFRVAKNVIIWGGQLLYSSAVPLLCCMAQNEHSSPGL